MHIRTLTHDHVGAIEHGTDPGRLALVLLEVIKELQIEDPKGEADPVNYH